MKEITRPPGGMLTALCGEPRRSPWPATARVSFFRSLHASHQLEGICRTLS